MTTITFHIGNSDLDFDVVGGGIRQAWLPPQEQPESWDLSKEELEDLEAFAHAGWQFQMQPEIEWRAAILGNAGSFEAGLLARRPGGGLVVIRDHIIVTVPPGTDWIPSGPDFVSITPVPFFPRVFDVQVNLPDSDLSGSIINGIAALNASAGGLTVAEPLLLQHFVNPGYVPEVTVDSAPQWHWKKIELAKAWNRINSMPSAPQPIRVAIIDFGFHLNEPQLVGRIDWYAFVDDYGGHLINRPNVMPTGNQAHGTLCAGIVGANLDGISVNGAAPDCRLILVAIQSVSTQLALSKAIHLAAFGDGSASAADVTSASIGTAVSQSGPYVGSLMTNDLRRAIDESVHLGRSGLGLVLVWSDLDAGVAITADSLEGYPPIILVGQSNYRDIRVTCGYGSSIDLLAPGSSISGICWVKGKPAIGLASGTSVAAPMVAGVAALILKHRPLLGGDKVAIALTETADPVQGQAARPDDYCGWGRVNALQAVLKAETL
jgi:subtilisin family serine protease